LPQLITVKAYIVGKNCKLKNRIVIVGNAVANENLLENISKNYILEKLSPVDFKQNSIIYMDTIALWIHFDTYLDSRQLKKIHEIPFLISTTTGLTHISSSIQAHFKNNLISLKGHTNFLRNISATAEHAWSLVMLSNNRLEDGIKSVQRGDWERQKYIRKRQISTQTLGIIGFGRLGKMVAEYGRAFNMKVLIHDINKNACQEAVNLGFSLVDSVQDLLINSDIVSLHANFDSNAERILSSRELNLINKPTALINTSRAGLVDEIAIIKEIENKPYLQYLTDVMAFEEDGGEITDSKLWKKSLETNRIVITPHIGGANKEAMNLCEEELYKIFLIQQAK
jgi:D-3-phosphoglycerate dehydrogenase